jgi:cell division protein FtsQ
MKNISKKQWLRIIKISVFVIGSVFLLGFAKSLRNSETVKSIEISIENDSLNHFISKNEVTQLLKDQGFRVIGERVKDINLHRLETLLGQHAGVKKIDAFCTIEGVLHIQIKQRNPMLRIFDTVGESYYIDEDGTLMPTLSNYTARVPVATGLIADPAFKLGLTVNQIDESDSLRKVCVVDDLYKLATTIQKDTFLRAQIIQINVNNQNEYELIPLIGADEILIGDTKDLNEKIEKLKLFYQQSLPSAGLNTYKTINLKFKGQVIGVKRSESVQNNSQTYATTQHE